MQAGSTGANSTIELSGGTKGVVGVLKIVVDDQSKRCRRRSGLWDVAAEGGVHGEADGKL